jgi:hypothetical protein
MCRVVLVDDDCGEELAQPALEVLPGDANAA